MSSPSRPEDKDRDLDDWLDGLRGRAQPGASPTTQAEAQAQRAAVRAAHEAQREGDDPQELQRLLFRLRREGLLGGASEAAASTARAPARWRLPLAAAAVLALGLALTMVGPGLWQAGEAPVLRSGATEQVLEVPAGEVAATAQRLAAALRDVGAAVAVVSSGDATEVAATVPEDRLPQAAQALASFGLKPPAADGSLRVEVRPRAGSTP